MDGKKLKDIVRRIPDDAVILKICQKYIAWREGGQYAHVYSFYPECLDEEISINNLK